MFISVLHSAKEIERITVNIRYLIEMEGTKGTTRGDGGGAQYVVVVNRC